MVGISLTFNNGPETPAHSRDGKRWNKRPAAAIRIVREAIMTVSTAGEPQRRRGERAPSRSELLARSSSINSSASSALSSVYSFGAHALFAAIWGAPIDLEASEL
jgi:hypothetical protein